MKAKTLNGNKNIIGKNIKKYIQIPKNITKHNILYLLVMHL